MPKKNKPVKLKGTKIHKMLLNYSMLMRTNNWFNGSFTAEALKSH